MESAANCTDTDGGFTCACVEGFVGNGTFCMGTCVIMMLVLSVLPPC